MEASCKKGGHLMSEQRDSLLALVEQLKRKAPEYLDLISAQTDQEFEEAFDSLLEGAVSHLEKNCKNFQRLDEEGLSAVLAGTLSVPGLTVTQETNSNGHVDLTIEADHCTPKHTVLGEAKIYATPSYHFSGIEQLLKRYTTGREGRGLLIIYFRKRNIRGLIGKLRERMNADLPCGQTGPSTDHRLKWSFLTSHSHNSGEELSLGHIGCNLYVETDK
jgi:hypothetical protein